MGITRANLRTLVRALLSEPSASYWSDAELDTYIQYGVNDFCAKAGISEDISTISLVQYQADYDWPSDCIKLKRIEQVNGNTINCLYKEDLSEQYQGSVKNTNTSQSAANIWASKIRLRDRPTSAATADTLSAAITDTAATTLTLSDSSDFPKAGRIIIGTEVIEYWYNDTDTGILSVASRGMEGTTAATHSAAAAVTLRDIWLYHTSTQTLTSDISEFVCAPQFNEAPAYYAAMIGRRKSKDHDLSREYKAVYDEMATSGLIWSKEKVQKAYRTK